MFPWGQFLSYIFVTGWTPGPNNIISLSNGSRLGWRRGLPYDLGLLCAQLIYHNICIYACRLINELLPSVVPYLRILGAAYILYLAWGIFRGNTELSEQEEKSSFWQGFAMQFLNPKLFFYIFVPAETFILPYYQDRPAVLLLFGCGLALNSFCSSLCWLSCGSLFRRFLSRWGRAVNTVMALLLCYCALSLFL